MCAADPIPAERSLVAAFATVKDPRCPINRRHRLGDMIVLAVAAVLAGADGWQDVERFGRAKEAWFRQFLALPHGIPSHDTFGRVFALLDPQAFERCFRNWVAAICALLPGEIIAVDGKTTVETRDYIGSIGTDVACFARAVRGHWGVENVLHWRLDMTFREDACRVRQPAARENLAVLRRIALTRLKQDNAKFSLRNKRNTAGWDDRYLAKLLFDAPSSLSSA